MEQVGFATANGQTFQTGVQGFSSPPDKMPEVVTIKNPNAPRWLFNPFAWIKREDKPVSGHSAFLAGVFIPIINQVDRQAPAYGAGGGAFGLNKSFSGVGQNTENGYAPLEGTHAGGGVYKRVSRSSYAIAQEIEDEYAERGVRIIQSLTGFSDDAAVGVLHKEFIAAGLEYRSDPNLPEFPVPNLVRLEKYLVTVAAAISSRDEAQRETRDKAEAFQAAAGVAPSEILTELLASVREALKYCRNVTKDAKKHIANKTIGYLQAFDAHQQRCFIALGEETPSDLPYNSPVAQNATDSSEVVSLRRENDRLKEKIYADEIAALKAENARLKAAQTDATETVRCDFIKANNEQCKANALNGTDRCSAHKEKGEN